MVELRETDTARAMLRQTHVFQRMRQDDPDRLMRLERLCNQTYFDIRCDTVGSWFLMPCAQKIPCCGRTIYESEGALACREVYGGTPKDKRRAQLAHSLSQEVTVVPPSRLMALIGQALKWYAV